MDTRKLVIFVGLLIIGLCLIGCGPSQAESNAKATQVAANLSATQTAENPSPTLTPTPIPPTETPTSTSTSTSTATPVPPTNTPTAEPTNTPMAKPTLGPPPLEELVTFHSNAFAEFTGVTISFQHPREWQTSYFSDSGTSGWLVSDADPNDAFWDALNTGKELIVLLIPVGSSEQLSDLKELSQEPGYVEFEADGKKVSYVITKGQVRGAVVSEQAAFLLYGFFPAEKEAAVRRGIETIFSTLAWKAIGDVNLSDVWLLGTRYEGSIGFGDAVEGYVPLASTSEWGFEGSLEQEIHLAVNTRDPEVTLVIDVLDKNGKSLLPSGPNKFTGSFEIEHLKLPADGTYTVQVSAPTGFAKYFPDHPASEAKVYGWYQISMEAQ